MKLSLLSVPPISIPQAQGAKTPQAVGETFAAVLKDKIAQVNTLQKEADLLTERLIIGEEVELHEVMIAVEKAELAMQLTLQIRNKLLEAYQEMSKMQI
ncbi:MAG: flagellar hook-basal body complex protein FliE [Bacillota bacterium]